MAIIDLEKSLSDLHKELKRLSPAIELSEKAVETVNIAKAIPERHQQLITELKSIFINPEELTEEEFENVYSTITNLITELRKVEDTLDKYTGTIAEFIKYLKNNDIPNKLDAINFQLTGINNSLLAVQGQLNTIQSSINNIGNTVENIRQNIDKIIADVKNSKESLENQIKSFQDSSTQQFQEITKRQDKQDKEIKALKTILYIICGLIIIGTITTIVLLK